MHDAHRIICREHRNLVALLSCLKALVREAEAAERMPDFNITRKSRPISFPPCAAATRAAKTSCRNSKASTKRSARYLRVCASALSLVRRRVRRCCRRLPAAERLLRAEDWEEIDAAFRANEDPLFGANWRHEYERLFSEIAARSPVPIGPGRPSGD
jgi:hypothetical protein